ncbi:hypothetical protein F183_A29700 [Bryobacterales bacterium F-183]|nr:hypothetical protein F183_A29700 [Bryobacterales bacterium F-183]
MGSTASERLSLLLEARTTGEQALAALEKQINSVLSAADKTDKAGAQIQRVRDSAASASEATQGFGETLREFAANPLSVAQNKFDDIVKSAGTFGVVIGAGTAAVVAGGTALFGYAKNLAASAEAAANLSAQTGLSIKEITLLKSASENANVGAEGLLESYKGLSRALATAGDESKKAREALAAIGVNPNTPYGGPESTYRMILKIAGGLEAVQDPAKRAQRAIEILGEPGLKLLPLLTSNLAGTLKELDTLGVGLEDKAAAQALKFDTALDRLNTNISVLKKNLGELGSSKFDGALQLLAFFAAAANGKLDLGALGLKQPTNQRPNWADLPIARPDTMNADGSPKYTAANTPAALLIQQALRANSDALRVGGFAGPSTADLEATLQLSTRNRITGLIASRDGTEGRIQRAEKELADAIAANNENQVRETLALLTGLKQQLVDQQAVKRFMDGGSLTGVLNRVYPNLPTVYRGPDGQIGRFGQKRLSDADIAGTELFAALSTNDVNLLPSGRRSLLPTNVGSFGAEQYKQVVEESLAAGRQRLDFQARMVELMTGPGGEVEAINRITALRLEALDKEEELIGRNADIDRQRDQAKMDRTMQILSLQKAALNNSADQLFSVAIGQTSTGDFARNTALTIGRNAFGAAYRRIGGTFGDIGKATGLGGLLSGTFLDPAQSGPVTENTTAVDANTRATQELTKVISTISYGGDPAGGGGVITLPGGIMLPTSVFGGSLGSSPIFSAARRSSSTNQGTPIFNELGEIDGYAPAGASGLAKGVGIAGAGLAGGFGILSGVRQGGLRGGFTAASAGAGTISTLMAVGAIGGGPVGAAIAAGAALGIEFAKTLLPDPKAARSRAQDRYISAAMYSGPGSGSYEEDIYGRQNYYDQGGRYVVVNINTMDAKSFIDNRSMISDAVRQSLQEAHPLNQEIMGLSAP